MAKKIFIEDMTTEQRTEVFNKNQKLRHLILDDMQDSEMDWISEKLDYIRSCLSDWEIGIVSHCWIKTNPSKIGAFLDGMEKMSKDFQPFNDEDQKRIMKELKAAVETYFNANSDLEEYEELEEKAIQAVQQTADELARQFQKDLACLYDSKNQLDYFLEFYADARMDGNQYYIIAGDENYGLKRDVSYIESFK